MEIKSAFHTYGNKILLSFKLTKSIGIFGDEKDSGTEDTDYQPNILIDPTNPEALLIAKETFGMVLDHFSETEIAYLIGEMDLSEAAELSGNSCEAFRRQLDRHRVDFMNCMAILDQ